LKIIFAIDEASNQLPDIIFRYLPRSLMRGGLHSSLRFCRCAAEKLLPRAISETNGVCAKALANPGDYTNAQAVHCKFEMVVGERQERYVRVYAE
jgi:hypothetical protein